MPAFIDLPIELIPLILQHLVKPQHLALCCGVSKLFYESATPLLYERAFIYAWYKEAKLRVMRLFWTLANRPHLARYVRRLELRDFPKALSLESREELESNCLKGLQNCCNLRACTWTRDGSLSSPVLQTLRSCTSLRELEINGHHNGNYNPQILIEFSNLSKISLIMPSSQVIGVAPEWFSNTGSTLRALTIICKASPLVTDSLLALLAPRLSRLEQLHIAGCSKVTHKGISGLLSANESGIMTLGLEGLSPLFDMKEFSDLCRTHNSLVRLNAITLTFPLHGMSSDWLFTVNSLLSDAPLSVFQLYASGDKPGISPRLSNEFVESFTKHHGERLKRFAVLRSLIPLEVLEIICTNCTILEQLFILISRADLLFVPSKVSRLDKLRSLHLSFPQRGLKFFGKEEALDLARKCGQSLRQFGALNRVWQVERIPIINENGEVETKIDLGQYESPEVPDIFLVMRT